MFFVNLPDNILLKCFLKNILRGYPLPSLSGSDWLTPHPGGPERHTDGFLANLTSVLLLFADPFLKGDFSKSCSKSRLTCRGIIIQMEAFRPKISIEWAQMHLATQHVWARILNFIPDSYFLLSPVLGRWFWVKKTCLFQLQCTF